MAFRSDITIDWFASPRIITVAAPSAEVIVQDLIDTLRVLESDFANLTHPYIVDSFGKLDYTGGKFSGIQLILRDALLAFEDRPGPAWVQCEAKDGVLLAAITDPITGLILTYLSNPFQTTTFVTAIYEKDVSAALISSDVAAVAAGVWGEDLSTYTTEGEAGDIQRRQAFGDGVWIASGSGYSGTAFPLGTRSQPVDNFADAKAIADANNLNKFWMQVGDGLGITMPNTDLQGYDFEGVSLNSSLISLASQNYSLCSFRNLFLIGNSIGGLKVFGGIMSSLTLSNGEFHQSDIAAPMVCTAVAGYFAVTFEQSFSRGAGAVDANDKLAFVYIRRCAGEFAFRNFSVAGSVLSIDMTGGIVTLENTCTAGTITISGTCAVIDNSNGATVIDQTELSWMKKKLLTLAAYVGLK